MNRERLRHYFPQRRESDASKTDGHSGSKESWQGYAGSESGSELGSVNSNLEQHGCQDQMARVTTATITETMAGVRATTLIAISELELLS